MPTARAVRLCPDLIIVPARHGVYSAASQQVMDRLATLTPLIEQISIDEAFLDISDLPEPGEAIAQRIQASIRDELGLPCSIGIASNKLLAKTATDVGKASHRSSGPPFAILVVPPGQEAAFLASLPVQALWGIGPKTGERMASLGIHTIGDLASLPEAQLAYYFGKMGYELALRARGIDNRPVVTSHAVKSISQETTFERDVNDPQVLERTLQNLSAQVGYRLRQESLSGSTVRLKLRWSDFTTLTRQITLRQATNQDITITTAAGQLFRQTWEKGRLVRLLGVGVSGLGPALRQLSLWDDAGMDKEHRLLEAVDELRQRYGKSVIRRGKA